jgi:predicted small secreted protein
MRALAIHTGFHARSTVISMTLAVAMLLVGCAVNTTPGIGHSGSTCGMNAVLYCDLAPHVEKCQCFRHSELRDMMRTLSRR